MNTAGDDASGPNTDCAPPGAILCGENERVNRNLPAGRRCVACEPGKTNAAGDNPAGATTECAPICDFASGDGDGVTEEYLGQAPSALVCAALVRETRPEANGATFRAAPKCTYSVRYEQDTDVALRPLRQPDAGCVTLAAETTSNEEAQASLQPELCLETPAPEMDRVLSAVGEESAEAPVCHDTALVVAALVRRNGHCLPQIAPLTKVAVRRCFGSCQRFYWRRAPAVASATTTPRALHLREALPTIFRTQLIRATSLPNATTTPVRWQ